MMTEGKGGGAETQHTAGPATPRKQYRDNYMEMMPYTLPVVFLLITVFHTPTLSGRNRVMLPNHLLIRPLYAICRMQPNTELVSGMPRVCGYIKFKQTRPQEKLRVKFSLHGLSASDSQSRAIHIHQYGDLSEGCNSTGGHYNPEGVHHPLHPGDFGNFIARNGKIDQSVDSKATLYGHSSVLGRAVVIHEKEDDMGRRGDAGSLLHGNAGGRLACCVIKRFNRVLRKFTTYQ